MKEILLEFSDDIVSERYAEYQWRKLDKEAAKKILDLINLQLDYLRNLNERENID